MERTSLYCSRGKETIMALPKARPKPGPKASESAVATKAALRAAERLKVSNRVLANVIGLSEATVSRMRHGGYALERGQKPFELAVLFARLYRSLDAIVGGDDAVAATWLRNHNTALDGEPLVLIQTVSGLTNAVAYLDARRAVL